MRKLFDFKCEQCEHKQEHFVDSNDTLECPKCQSQNYKKTPGVGGFKFNGGGYYCTDFK